MEPVHYEDRDESPHDPGPDPSWQESVFLHWYDPKVGVGGIHRIGHEVSAGVTALWCGVVASDGTLIAVPVRHGADTDWWTSETLHAAIRAGTQLLSGTSGRAG